MKVQLVVFDFDGTLFDTHQSIAHTLALTMAQLLPHDTPAPTETAIRTSISSGASLSDTIRQLYPVELTLSSPDTVPALDDILLHKYLTTYRSLYEVHGIPLIKPFPYARDLLHNLQANSVPVAIVSNKGIAAVRQVLTKHELSSLVQLIVGDGEPANAPRKPDPGSWDSVIKPFFEKELQSARSDGGSTDLQPRNVLIVGDTVADIRYAQNIGARSVWCSYGYGEKDQCMALEPDHVVTGLNEVASLL